MIVVVSTLQHTVQREGVDEKLPRTAAGLAPQTPTHTHAHTHRNVKQPFAPPHEKARSLAVFAPGSE